LSKAKQKPEATKEVSETKKTVKKGFIAGTGRRKTAVARVFLYQEKGAITVNDMDINEYFPSEIEKLTWTKPFHIIGVSHPDAQFSASITVKGSGRSAQLGAVVHGISRALAKVNEEYDQAVQLVIKLAKEQEKEPVTPSDDGGYGYDRLLRPHSKCPYCCGEGREELHVEDTRDLSPKAKLLYAGIKQTATGIEIKMQDQGKALENVARHLGMFNDTLHLTGKLDVSNPFAGLTTEELKKLIDSG